MKAKLTLEQRIEWHRERSAVYQALYNRLPVSCTMRRAHAIFKMQEHKNQLNFLTRYAKTKPQYGY